MVPFAIISLLLILFNNNISYGECKVSSSSTTNPLVPALYVFGDSLVDSGNNNWLNTDAKANYTPYGIDFPAIPRATGRVTNGKTLADLLWTMQYFGTTSRQLYKNNRREELKPNMNAEELRQYLSQSIFLIIIGSNDYLVNYFPKGSSVTYTPEEFANLLINNLSDKLEELYKLGVRKAIVSGVPALGCLPKTKINNVCNETKNEMALIYNNKLDVLMNNFSATYPDSLFTQAHIYDLSYDAFFNPTQYGLAIGKFPCCLLIPEVGACLPFLPPCINRNAYYFFDGYHPTQAFYSIVANQCINGSSTCLPFNIEQLVQLQHNLPPSLLNSA